MSSQKKDPAEFFADLEGDANVLAVAPYLIAKERRQKKISAVREAVLDALVALGYETDRANRVAEKLANQLPTVEGEP
ncbi:MAG: hypothetical protein JNK82_33355 [Myxococcaceae bacterium]|nr:hypothetical protein [Myxococcaceae bacterium]